MLAVALYWGHFGDVYKVQLARVQAAVTTKAAAPATSAAAPGDPGGGPTQAPVPGRAMIPVQSRAVNAVRQTAQNLGWPILVLALVGAWRLLVDRRRDPLALAVAAWAAVGVAFVAGSVLAAVDARYQQDAWEFIARVEHATCPAAAILAAAGATWAWRAGAIGRIAACALLAAAVVVGFQAWTAWM